VARSRAAEHRGREAVERRADAGTEEIGADELGLSGRLVEDDRLAHGFNARTLGKIAAAHPEAEQLMVVGHEPELSATVSAVIGGGAVVMRNGGLARVDLPEGSLGYGVLAWLLTSPLLGGQ
jgi:phosphohistidine phosphatase SixA